MKMTIFSFYSLEISLVVCSPRSLNAPGTAGMMMAALVTLLEVSSSAEDVMMVVSLLCSATVFYTMMRTMSGSCSTRIVKIPIGQSIVALSLI